IPQRHPPAPHDGSPGAELLRPGHRRHRRLPLGPDAVSRTMKTSAFVLALGAAALLSACGGTPAEPGVVRATSVNALPEGRIAEGEARANVKGTATGQSCIDCHGADGNNPLDPTYPKIGGQYRDYLAHALQAYRSGSR